MRHYLGATVRFYKARWFTGRRGDGTHGSSEPVRRGGVVLKPFEDSNYKYIVPLTRPHPPKKRTEIIKDTFDLPHFRHKNVSNAAICSHFVVIGLAYHFAACCVLEYGINRGYFCGRFYDQQITVATW